MKQTIEQKIIDLHYEISDDCVVVMHLGGGEVSHLRSSKKFVEHPKAQKMLNLLMKFHGSKNITGDGVYALLVRLQKECGIVTGDHYFTLLMSKVTTYKVRLHSGIVGNVWDSELDGKHPSDCIGKNVSVFYYEGATLRMARGEIAEVAE
ncbi:hypothetical protein BGL48_11950 [Salinivibrio sp. SS3]|uniref:Uncharacterized protein n=1 Tax=Salinivibrio phage SMHB1 TaxID=1897436 RepID=A0A1D9C9R4_9CAUD|nr:hypothetical protein [Salinivibrio sp. BNH]YP_009786965.1 hypothetical protein HOR26_gp23 [Salinivibrio phage SMHB1]AOY11828.1 hypothetical protein [Salinivibrio phage SMHB1]ODP98287.1 hypothetical protein BGL48_11950 [Salinivibrio sp. BNH]